MGPLLMAGLAAGAQLIGSGIGALQKNKAKKTMNNWYDYAEGYDKTQANSSIFDSAAGKSLLKLDDLRNRKALDALDNQMAAGGGTIENALAARQSVNEGRDRINSQLLQYDERNRRAWQEKGLDISGQRANFNANSYMQSAQDWSQWGSQMAGSLLSLGSTGLLSGTGTISGVDASQVAGSGANVFGAAVSDFKNAPATINYDPIPKAPDVSSMGGLREVKYMKA